MQNASFFFDDGKSDYQRAGTFSIWCERLIVRCISQVVVFLITLDPLLSGGRLLGDKSALRVTTLWWGREEPPKHLVTSGVCELADFQGFQTAACFCLIIEFVSQIDC